MKSVIRPWIVLALFGLACPGLGWAQASGPTGFTKKQFESKDSVPVFHSGSAAASYPNAPGQQVAWPSCSKQTALIAELEKTVALQSKRIEELEAAVKVAGKGAK